LSVASIARDQRVLLAGPQRDDLDLGVELRAERRENRQLAQPRSVRAEWRGQRQRGCKDRDGYRSTHGSPSLTCS
jgi:hypothetical protein